MTEVEDVEVPVRKVAEGGERAVLQDEHLDILVLLEVLFDVNSKLVDLDLAQVHLLDLTSVRVQLFQPLPDLWQCAHYLYYYQDIYLNILIAYFKLQNPKDSSA